MSVCPSCMAEGWAPGSRCPSCGATPIVVPDLDIPEPPPPKRRDSARKNAVPEFEPLELATEVPDLPRAAPVRAPPARAAAPAMKAAPVPDALLAYTPSEPPAEAPPDVEFEAKTLADYGDPPKEWYRRPQYAYRVWKRQAELKKALVARREEAALAKTAADDALVACGERVRPRAAKHAQYGSELEVIQKQEAVLRSRDHSLAKEQDVHAERIASVEARISRLEAEVASAKAEERTIAAELSEIEMTIQRAEAKIKRAEIELRNTSAVRETKNA